MNDSDPQRIAGVAAPLPPVRSRRGGRCRWPLPVVALALASWATTAAAENAETPLSAIRAELELARAEAPRHVDTRGASERLTVVKHRLREWVESHLAEVPSDPNGPDGADVALTVRLNAELDREHLFTLQDAGAEASADATAIGSLGDVRVAYRLRQTYLVLTTAVGVDCGFDESAYLYRWQGRAWKRIWETEQSTYTKGRYAVQRIRAVLVSPPLESYFDSSVPLVLTLGTYPWCSSNWQTVYVRLWRVEASKPDPTLLLDKSEIGYLGAHDEPVQGSVGRSDALIEYRVGSIDGGVHNRERVLHYAVKPDGVERVGPIAFGPRDFVEEWLGEPWPESRRWSEPSAVAALERAHAQPRGDEFLCPTRHCRPPDLWQVGLGASDGKRPPTYYLVRWRPPYDFTMLRASDRPDPDCTEEDPGADDERTLFAVQDWRE